MTVLSVVLSMLVGFALTFFAGLMFYLAVLCLMFLEEKQRDIRFGWSIDLIVERTQR
jgi:hypothetical protein